VLAVILPYLELEVLYDPMDDSKTTPVGLFDIDKAGPIWSSRLAAWEMAHADVSAFLCPSHSTTRKQNVRALVHIHWDGGNYIHYTAASFTPTDLELGLTDYLGCAGVNSVTSTPTTKIGNDEKKGIFSNRSKTSHRDITDGTANTMMFGESTGKGAESNDPTNIYHAPYGWMGAGVMWTANSPGIETTAFSRFSSEHPGIVQYCFADGSVHSLSTEIEFALFHALSTMKYGEVFEPPWRQ
jgi:hypothetical protein